MSVNPQLKNQETVIVFGGSGGLGASICKVLASTGRDVAFTYQQNKEKAEQLAEQLNESGAKAKAFQLDTRDYGSIVRGVERISSLFSGIKHVIYAAGPLHPVKKMADLSIEEWDTCIDAHVKGFFYVFKATIDYLRASGGGTYVALTTAATSRYVNDDATSAVPKSAVELMTRAIASEEGKQNIRANCVAPGLINSGALIEHMKDASIRELIDRSSELLPLPHLGDELDVAEATLFLISEKSKYITGQTIFVDGGMGI